MCAGFYIARFHLWHLCSGWNSYPHFHLSLIPGGRRVFSFLGPYAYMPDSLVFPLGDPCSLGNPLVLVDILTLRVQFSNGLSFFWVWRLPPIESLRTRSIGYSHFLCLVKLTFYDWLRVSYGFSLRNDFLGYPPFDINYSLTRGLIVHPRFYSNLFLFLFKIGNFWFLLLLSFFSSS